MKKFYVVLIAIIICSIFVACNNNADEFNNIVGNIPQGFEVKTSNKPEKSTLKNDNEILHPDIEKVIVSYYGKKEELIESEQSFDFIEKIIKCDSIPKVDLTEEIGKIEIKYYDKEKNTLFATLYMGSNMKLYAKYEKSKNPNYAYQITF